MFMGNSLLSLMMSLVVRDYVIYGKAHALLSAMICIGCGGVLTYTCIKLLVWQNNTDRVVKVSKDVLHTDGTEVIRKEEKSMEKAKENKRHSSSEAESERQRQMELGADGELGRSFKEAFDGAKGMIEAELKIAQRLCEDVEALRRTIDRSHGEQYVETDTLKQGASQEDTDPSYSSMEAQCGRAAAAKQRKKKTMIKRPDSPPGADQTDARAISTQVP